jgi:L-malate glycosyltransferase
VKVLYVNHTSHVSGGERSLLTFLPHLPADVDAAVACPEGRLATMVRELGLPVLPITGTAGSLKLHPRRTPRALAEMGRAAMQVRAHARRHGADLLHANSIRGSLVAGVASSAHAPPTVAHIRDCLPPGPATRAVQKVVARSCALVVANSEYTRSCFLADDTHTASQVIANPVDLAAFDGGLDRAAARERLSLPADGPVLGVVAQITPWKGQDDAVRIVAQLRRQWPGIRLLLVGSTKFVDEATRHDNRAFLADLERLIAELGAGENVAFLGERDDVPGVMAAMDLLLVPSWAEPFGRVVVEGMAMGVPVAATSVGGPAEIIRPGVDGLLLPPREPEAWSREIAGLLAAPDRLAAMGEAGRGRARASYGVEAHVAALVRAYGATLDGRRPGWTSRLGRMSN